MSFGLVRPTTALADVDLLQNVRQFTFHTYANSDAPSLTGGMEYWYEMEFAEDKTRTVQTYVTGINTSSEKRRFFTDGNIITYVKNAICTDFGGRLTDGMEIDINCRAEFLHKGMNVLPLFSGYIMGSYTYEYSESGTTMQIESFATRYYWDECKWYGQYGTTRELLEQAEDGSVVIDRDYEWLMCRIHVRYNGTPPSSVGYLAVTKPQLILLSDATAINKQTSELMDTTGAEGVADGAMEYVSTVTGKLGFVQQAGETMTGLYEAVGNTTAVGTLRFPGVSWEGQTIIAAQDVPITGYLPSTVEERIRDGTTLVFILAWLSGLKRIYDRIFHGESDVIIDEE